MISDYQRYRIYEMLPGISIWGALLGGVLLAFIYPLAMIYFIIIFDVYWVLRVVYYSFYLILSWNRFRLALKIDWFSKLTNEIPNWEEKKNVIFLPLANENYEVVKGTLLALLNSTYPGKKLYVILSGEARRQANWDNVQKLVKENFTGKFADLLYYTHPDNLLDEIPGKGSNIHHAELLFKKYADERSWGYKDVIISVFDVDTIVHPQYFAHLNYMYCIHPNPERSSFQPITLYNNNLWESPSVLRVMAFGTSFWMLFSLARMDGLVTFSSHSMSLKAALESGGHSKDIVSEDSRIFFQCWLHYGGDYTVTPLYIPVSMDTVRDDSWWKSLKNLYLQQRRWAWGSENIPFLLWQFRKHQEISLWKKAVVLFHEWEGKWSWAVVAILLTILGRLPLWVAGNDIRQSALFFNTPHVLETLMSLATMGLVFSAILGMLILPPRPESHPKYKYLFMVLQWLIVPFSMIFFSAIPCIDAVTHLMFGKYLGFNVSAKKRAV